MKHWMKREIEHSGECGCPSPPGSSRRAGGWFARSSLAAEGSWPVPFSEEGHLLRHTLGHSSAVSQRTLQGRFPPARLLRQEKWSRRSGGHVPTGSLGAIFFSKLKTAPSTICPLVFSRRVAHKV